MNEFSHKEITKISLSKTFNDEILNEVVNASILPDKDENQNGYVHHFYNPVTNTNYSSTEDSAKSRCIVHIGKYLITKNLEELGRAIHFLEDICTPVHVQYEDSTDAIIRGALHIEFEKRLDYFVETLLLSDTNKENEYSILLNSTFKNKDISIGKFIDFCALEAAKNYYLYRNDKEGLKDIAIKNTFDLAFFAVQYLYQTITNKNIEYAKILINGDNEDIGMVIKQSTLSNITILDLAPLNSNVRLRFNSKNEILIFERTSFIKNFVLKDVQNIL